MSRFEFLTSDVPFGGANSNIVTGVLSLASSFNPDYGPFHYWVEDKAILVEAFAHFHTRGLDLNKFTLYSDKATWERLRAATAPLMPENLTVRSSDQPTTPNRPTVPAPPAPLSISCNFSEAIMCRGNRMLKLKCLWIKLLSFFIESFRGPLPC